MERSFQAAMLLHDPEIVFVLGEYSNVTSAVTLTLFHITDFVRCLVFLCSFYFSCSVFMQLNVIIVNGHMLGF